MTIHAEQVKVLPGDSIRLLRWERSLAEVVLIAGDGARQPIPGSGTIWHAHSEVEIALVESGEGTRFVGDSIVPITAPDLIMLGPELPHFWRFSGDSSGIVLQLDVDRLSGLWSISECADLARFWPRLNRGLQIQEELRDLLTTHLQRMVDARRIARIGILLELLHDVSQADVAQCDQSMVQPISGKAYNAGKLFPMRREMNRAVQYLLEHFEQPIQLEEMLRLTHMSKPSFSRHFRAFTGKTFIEFLCEVRVDECCRALVASADPVTEIAVRAGFSSLAHFNRTFRRLKGMTPSEYRKKWDACRD